jgi:hypothetical protein
MTKTNRNKREIKKLSQIMNNKQFDKLVDLFTDSLRKRQEWKSHEIRVHEYKENGWPIDKVQKIFQWERMSFALYNSAHDKVIGEINDVASALSEQEFEDLGIWIGESKASKDAWNKKEVTIEDTLSIIKSRIAHIAYMMRSPKPINIGEIIDGS